MRAGIYIRVSTEEQALHGYSAAEQEEAGRRRIHEIALPEEPVEIYVFADLGYSGATLDRPKLTEMREWIRDGRLDLLVLRDPDRLSRKLAHQLLLTEEFEKAGLRLEFLDFEWKNTPEGRLFYSIKGAIAEYEREKIRERMMRGKLQKARQGGMPVGFTVYGYQYDPETGKVSINEDEAAVVRNIFKWFANEDIGIAGVTNRLNDLEIPTRKRTGYWHRQVVRQILVNPVFKGEWKYGKIDWHTRTPRPPREVITIPVPPIVDPVTWEKAQEKLREIRRLWTKQGRRKYLLSGLLTCADCGNTMGGAYIRWWGVAERRYTCRRARCVSRNQGCRPPKAIRADELEKIVWGQVKAFLCDPDTVAREAAASAPRADELRQEHRRIEKRLLEVERGREAVLDALASGLFELDVKTKAKLASLKEKRERLEARKKELEHVLRSTESAAVRMDELRTLAEGVLDRLDEMSFEEKRGLVRALIRQIVITGRPKPGRAAKSMEGVAVTVILQLEEAVESITNVSRKV